MHTWENLYFTTRFTNTIYQGHVSFPQFHILDSESIIFLFSIPLHVKSSSTISLWMCWCNYIIYSIRIPRLYILLWFTSVTLIFPQFQWFLFLQKKDFFGSLSSKSHNLIYKDSMIKLLLPTIEEPWILNECWVRMESIYRPSIEKTLNAFISMYVTLLELRILLCIQTYRKRLSDMSNVSIAWASLAHSTCLVP